MVINHIDMVILDIDMGYGLMIGEMTVSIWLSPISLWDIFVTLARTMRYCVCDSGTARARWWFVPVL